MLTWLPEHEDRSLLEKVDHLITPFTSGSARWLVESFQADEQLLDARALGRPVRVIHLVRDVRSWVHSEARRGVERHGRGMSVGWRSLVRWWRVNRRLSSGYGGLTVRYFSWAMRNWPWHQKQRCGAYATGLSCHLSGDASTRTAFRQPYCFWNRLRFEPGQSHAIRYDAAWLTSPALSLRVAPLLPSVAAMNRRLVYSHGLLGSTWPAA
jgi:hypothetical protein